MFHAKASLIRRLLTGEHLEKKVEILTYKEIHPFGACLARVATDKCIYAMFRTCSKDVKLIPRDRPEEQMHPQCSGKPLADIFAVVYAKKSEMNSASGDQFERASLC